MTIIQIFSINIECEVWNIKEKFGLHLCEISSGKIEKEILIQSINKNRNTSKGVFPYEKNVADENKAGKRVGYPIYLNISVFFLWRNFIFFVVVTQSHTTITTNSHPPRLKEIKNFHIRKWYFHSNFFVFSYGEQESRIVQGWITWKQILCKYFLSFEKEWIMFPYVFLDRNSYINTIYSRWGGGMRRQWNAVRDYFYSSENFIKINSMSILSSSTTNHRIWNNQIPD